MKKTKRFISALCAGIVTISAIYSSALLSCTKRIFAASADSSMDSQIIADENNITMEGVNSFGNLLADTLSEKEEEQSQNSGCNIFEVTMQGATASVSFETSQDAALVVGIYTESGEEMLASGMAEISKDEKEAYIEIQTEQMPEYFLLRAFMADKETLAPLCSFYESPNYTQEMQEFFAKTTDDFREEKVLNLDEDKTNNFAVYKDNIVQIQSQENINQIVSSDEENGIYVVENADETILSLQAGDIFSYQYGDGNLLIVKVKNINKEGRRITITREDTSLDEVFDYVKIDSSADMSKAEIDSSTCEEGVIYNGLTEWKEEDGIESYALDIEGSDSISASYIFKEKKLEAEGSAGKPSGSASVKVSGGVDLKIECSIKVYISFSYQYIEFKQDYSVKLKASVNGKATGKIKLGLVKFSPAPGVNIEFTPSFVVEVSAKIELSGVLKGTIGFRADSDTGGKNISSVPTFKTTLKVEGTVFLGLSLEPSINIVSEHIAKASIEALVGAEVKAGMSIIEPGSSSKRHDCGQCIEGEINGKFEVELEVKLVNHDKLKLKGSFGIELKIADFYYSFTFDEFGWDSCPHISYKTVVMVTNEKKEAVADAVVNVANQEYKTDKNGAAVCYLPNGEYIFTVEKTGYNKAQKKITIMDTGKEVKLAIIPKNTGYKTKVIVVDDKKNRVEGATVKVGEQEYITDKNGEAVCYLPSGEYVCTVEKTGYNEAQKKIAIIDIEKEIKIAITPKNASYKTKIVVIDDEKNQVEGAVVDVADREYVTNKNGEAVCYLPNGEYMLTVKKIGYEIEEQSIVIMDAEKEIEIIVTSINNSNQVIYMVSLGAIYSAAITETDDLYMWGSNLSGRLGDGTEVDKSRPVKIMEKVKSVSLGSAHSAAITETGDLYMWGSNEYGRLGDGTRKDKLTPVKIMERVKSVSLGGAHSAAITETGDLYMWGGNWSGQLGDGTKKDKLTPVKIMEKVKSISLGNLYSAAITETGDLYMWGYSSNGQLGNGIMLTIEKTPVKIMERVKSVSLGGAHGAAITETGDLYMWGYNGSGQLGDGTEVDKSRPAKIMEKVKSVSLGNDHSAVITETGNLYMWGYNACGQLGDGTKVNKSTPVKIQIPLNSTSSYFVQLLFYLHGTEPKTATELKKEVTVTSYDNLTPNGDYIFCLLKSDTAENLLAPDNLLYIAQSTADSEGKLSFSYISVASGTNNVTRLSEAGNYNINNTPVISGDINEDEQVNTKDAVLLKKYLAGYTGLNINTEAADVNGDNKIDSKDAVRLLRHLAGYEVKLGE